MIPETPASAYLEISLEMSKVMADAACNYIIENISSGLILEEEEDSDSMVVKFYIPVGDDVDFKNPLIEHLEHLSREYLVPVPTFLEKEIRNISWEEEYKRSVQPVLIGDDIVIKPTWDETDFDRPYTILIEPKMAFGTGTHETTRSCMHVLREQMEPGERFLDVGCGSGILSVLASQLEADFIKAIDYDEIAVENSKENFVLNNVRTPNEIAHGTIEICKDDEPYSFVCANIIRKTILEIIEELDRLTMPKGTLVLSGLLDIDVGEIKTALIDRNLKDYEIYEDNEWRTFIIFKG